MTPHRTGVGAAGRHLSRWIGLLVALMLSACSTTRPWSNEPLAAREGVVYDGRAQLVDNSRHPDLLVVASFWTLQLQWAQFLSLEA